MAAKHFIIWVSANFRNHITYLGDKKLSWNAYVTELLLFTKQLVSLKGKWLAKTEMCFSYWINGLLRTTMILL